MTAQVPDLLLLDGERLALFTNPLEQYFAMGGRKPGLRWSSTANWRCYVATWEVVNDRLYLIDIEGDLENGEPASLAAVFPGYADRVFAHWYNGELRIPQGERTNYVHMGYHSTFERDLLITVVRGVLTQRRIQMNRPTIAIDDNGELVSE